MKSKWNCWSLQLGGAVEVKYLCEYISCCFCTSGAGLQLVEELFASEIARSQ